MCPRNQTPQCLEMKLRPFLKLVYSEKNLGFVLRKFQCALIKMFGIGLDLYTEYKLRTDHVDVCFHLFLSFQLQRKGNSSLSRPGSVLVFLEMHWTPIHSQGSWWPLRKWQGSWWPLRRWRGSWWSLRSWQGSWCPWKGGSCGLCLRSTAMWQWYWTCICSMYRVKAIQLT